MALNSCSNFEKEESRRVTILDIQLHFNYTALKTDWYWYKNRHIDQWKRIESPEINLCLSGQLTHDTWGSSMKLNKNNIFNKWCWESWTATCKRAPTYTIHKNKFKVDKRLKCKP